MSERLLTPDEAADRLSVTPGAIREWIRSGKLRAVKAGRLWRIKESELGEFLDRSTVLQGYGQAPEENAAVGESPREYSRKEIREFLKADRITPATARKIESLLGK